MKSDRSTPSSRFMRFLLLLAIATPAYGYVDPNAYGLVSQILTPLLIAAAAGATFLRRQVGAVFAGLKRRLRRQGAKSE
jgi:hypothetical protein